MEGFKKRLKRVERKCQKERRSPEVLSLKYRENQFLINDIHDITTVCVNLYY